MIWLIAALAGGLALRAYAVLLLSLVYAFSRKSRDWTLAVYFIYGVLILGEVWVKDVLSYQSLRVTLMLLIPSLMALREAMEGFEIPRRPEPEVLIPVLLFITGVFYDALFFAGILIALLPGFKTQHFVTAKNLLAAVGFLIIVIGGIRLIYPQAYTPENQTAIIAAITILAVLFLARREPKRVDFRVV
jgi:hypothetical protein